MVLGVSLYWACRFTLHFMALPFLSLQHSLKRCAIERSGRIYILDSISYFFCCDMIRRFEDHTKGRVDTSCSQSNDVYRSLACQHSFNVDTYSMFYNIKQMHLTQKYLNSAEQLRKGQTPLQLLLPPLLW
jgi:hypothetical protein